MNKVDKLSKEVLNLFSYSKDIVTTNLNTANNVGNLEPKLTEHQLNFVLKLFENSLTQGYQKGISIFQKTLKNVLNEEVKETKKKNK